MLLFFEIYLTLKTFFYAFAAPRKVNLKGNLTVIEGRNNSYVCLYNDSYPVGDMSIYYIDGMNVTLDKVRYFSIKINNILFILVLLKQGLRA